MQIDCRDFIQMEKMSGSMIAKKNGFSSFSALADFVGVERNTLYNWMIKKNRLFYVLLIGAKALNNDTKPKG